MLRRRALQQPGYLTWAVELARTLANPENSQLEREDAVRMFVQANEGIVPTPEGGALEPELDEIPEVWSNDAVESLLHGIASAPLPGAGQAVLRIHFRDQERLGSGLALQHQLSNVAR